MALNRRVGFGFALSVDASGGTSFTPLGAVVDGFKGPGSKRETPDTSVLSDLYKTVGQAQIEPGEMTFMIAYDPDETTSTTLNNIFVSQNQTAPNWKISYPVGSGGSGTIVSETFKGFISGLSREVKVEQRVTVEVTVKVSGDPGYYHS